LLAQPFAIARGITRTRRPMRTLLAKWEIVAHDLDILGGESIRQCDQQRGVAIRAGAMCEDQNFQGMLLEMKKGRSVQAALSSMLWKLLARVG